MSEPNYQLTRAERIELEKSLIDAEIDILRDLRDGCDEQEMWNQYDKDIDNLLVMKDNVSAHLDYLDDQASKNDLIVGMHQF